MCIVGLWYPAYKTLKHSLWSWDLA
jgi:hypothetical protein